MLGKEGVQAVSSVFLYTIANPHPNLSLSLQKFILYAVSAYAAGMQSCIDLSCAATLPFFRTLSHLLPPLRQGMFSNFHEGCDVRTWKFVVVITGEAQDDVHITHP